MTTFTVPAPGPASHGSAIAWRKLAWATWRQHRLALAGTLTLLGGLSLLMLINGLAARSHHLGQVACHSAGGCYIPGYSATANTIVTNLQLVPALIGIFVGGPLLAREYETGTFRFAWTQECGRLRWTVAKLIPLAAAVTLLAAGLSLVTSWYTQPFVTTGLLSSIRPTVFSARGADFAAWTLEAFAIAAFAGAIVKRVIPAMVAAGAAWAGLFSLTTLYVRPHYQTALTGKSTAVTVRWWIVGESRGGALVNYQPADRFWHFQLIECSWLLVLAVLLGAATIWLVCRRSP